LSTLACHRSWRASGTGGFVALYKRSGPPPPSRHRECDRVGSDPKVSLCQPRPPVGLRCPSGHRFGFEKLIWPRSGSPVEAAFNDMALSSFSTGGLKKAQTKIIPMSSHTEDAYRLMASDSGAGAFVNKAVLEGSLLPAIGDVIARRLSGGSGPVPQVRVSLLPFQPFSCLLRPRSP
jgi:hypothetical protein